MLLIILADEEKRVLVGWRPDIPGKISYMHSNFQNCIQVSDVDRPHGLERVILNDRTKMMQCMAELDKACPSFGYVAF